MAKDVVLDSRLKRELHDTSGDRKFIPAVYPLVDFSAPEMPLPGPDFLDHAVALGDEIDLNLVKKKKLIPQTEKLLALYRQATYVNEFCLPVATKGYSETQPALFVPGRFLNEKACGPLHTGRVMVVGKMPGKVEQSTGLLASSQAMLLLKKILFSFGVTDQEVATWYVTFACKFAPPVDDITTLQASWLRDCSLILEQEIRLVAPDYILCLGSEATKCVTGVKGSVANLGGRVLPRSSLLADGSRKEISVMSVLHPAFVVRKPEVEDQFSMQIGRFVDLLNSNKTASDAAAEQEKIDHAEIYTETALKEVVDEMIADRHENANIIALDCEWHGEHPADPGSYLRTVQVSNKDRWARTIVLRHQGGQPAFYPSVDVVRRELNRLLKSTADRHVRVGGHFFRADLPWLIHLGVDVREEYAPAPDPEDRKHGGWDTSLMYHAVNECARFGLDECTMKFTDAPVYWEDLDAWKKAAKTHKTRPSTGGYGNCPNHILHPYASYDVDVTRRIMLKFYGTDGTDGLLANDPTGVDCWLPYWLAHGASLAFLEMEMTGMELDRPRADALTTLFMNTQDTMLAEIRAALNWPNFNPKSQPQLAVALFGKEYAARCVNPPEVPEDATLLNLVPIKTTGKRPTLWHELRQRGIDEEKVSPSTDRESLGILGHKNTTAAKIRDYKFMAQVLQATLRKPVLDEDTGDFAVDADGNFLYEKGLVGSVCADNRVRTHFFQTKETGRASSSRPPMQNLSSRREDDYRRILAENYRHPIRSILRVPEGYVGIETDLTGAELAVLAWLSQDQNMIEHVRRNILPEDHPEHYDIHSQQAVKAFNLQGIEPTKKGLLSVGKKGLRVAAKNVNFGIPYGRGPAAIARQCKEEGVSVSEAECQEMIDAYFDSYPKTATFLADCRARSQTEGFLVGPYGRVRRFYKSTAHDRAIVGEQQRQAQNFPIQGGVADAVSLALRNFIDYRRDHPDLEYRIIMQIHDSIVLMVPIEQAEFVYKKVVPFCMVDSVPFYPRRLDGTIIPDAGPYYFGTDSDVFVHWGEKISEKEAAKIGLSWLYE